MTQQEVNAVMYQAASDWYAALGLEIDGVNLGDAMKYDTLRITGRLIEQESQGDGRNES